MQSMPNGWWDLCLISLLWLTHSVGWHLNTTTYFKVLNKTSLNSNLRKQTSTLACFQRLPCGWCALFRVLWQWVEVSGGACWSWMLNALCEVAGFHVAHCAGACSRGYASPKDRPISKTVLHTNPAWVVLLLALSKAAVPLKTGGFILIFYE